MTLKNPNFWTHHYLEVDHLHVDGVIVRSMNLDPHQPNGDGIVIDGCRHVLIENMDIEAEDDGITLKSTSFRPMKDVLIRNNVVTSNVNAIKIGTETHGTIQDVVFRNNRVRFGGRAALTVQSVDGVEMRIIHMRSLEPDVRSAMVFDNASNVRINQAYVQQINYAPVVRLCQVSDNSVDIDDSDLSGLKIRNIHALDRYQVDGMIGDD